MFILYTVAPLLYRLASSAYYNLSLLSSDFFGLLFGLFLFHYRPYWLYFPAFVVVLVGLVVYFWSATRECFPVCDRMRRALTRSSGGAGRARPAAACVRSEDALDPGGGPGVDDLSCHLMNTDCPCVTMNLICIYSSLPRTNA
jgi:hypothetical protein